MVSMRSHKRERRKSRKLTKRHDALLYENIGLYRRLLKKRVRAMFCFE
jgi:hypothetical protein